MKSNSACCYYFSVCITTSAGLDSNFYGLKSYLKFVVVAAAGFITAPTERIGVFFVLVFAPTLLGGFIEFTEFVFPILPIRGSAARGYVEMVTL